MSQRNCVIIGIVDGNVCWFFESVENFDKWVTEGKAEYEFRRGIRLK